jgi:hypothetical protein
VPRDGAFCLAFSLECLDRSYRIYNCAGCAKQTILCRKCDRGNIYCSETCAAERRCRSLQQAGARYQKTLKGRHAHAQRQKCYRQRVSVSEEKVTHQGSIPEQECVSLEKNKFGGVVACRTTAFKRELAREIRCHLCGRICGPFGRYEFWRGGRGFSRLRRRNDGNSGDRGRDSPPVPR